MPVLAHGLQFIPELGVVRSPAPFFYFDVRNHISGTAEARVAKFCIQVEYIKC